MRGVLFLAVEDAAEGGAVALGDGAEGTANEVGHLFAEPLLFGRGLRSGVLVRGRRLVAAPVGVIAPGTFFRASVFAGR